jgi:hypothetical protein
MPTQKKSYVRLSVVTTAVAVLTVFSYQLLWGKLFPYSPVKPGFTKHELSHMVIYVQDGCNVRTCETVDALMQEIEDFHGMRFTSKPEVLVFRDSESYLQRSITSARFCAYPNGSLVVSPWAVREALDGKISMEIYLRHELSHVLLYQHMGFITAYFFYPRWLLEGIAVYSTHQMGTSWYPSKAETYAYIREGNFLPPEHFNTQRENSVPLRVRYKTTFMYSEFACIVDYLIATYGKDRFMQYTTQLLTSCRPEKVFTDVYGMNFEVCLRDFKRHVDEQ